MSAMKPWKEKVYTSICQLSILYTSICQLNTWYIHGIYWCKMNTHGASGLNLVCINIYIIYIYVIYLLYTWYIHGIFQSYVDVLHMERIYVVKHFWVCPVPFIYWYTFDIYWISKEYSWIIHGIWMVYDYKKRYGTDPKMFYYVYIPTICMTSTYDWNIPCIYHVYTMHILGRFWYHSYIPWIYMVYTSWYIPCIYIFYCYDIQYMYRVYT